MDEVEATSLRKQLDEEREKLKRTERQLERSRTYNEELRQQIETLSAELHSYRHRTSLQNRKEVECQVSEADISQACGDKPFPDWGITGDRKSTQATEEQTETTTSIADSLKAAAEEVVRKETGFVYDSTSGLYYDYNSGYYYDSVRSLYYDPSTTSYFYYDETEQAYKFHSYASGQYDQQMSGGDIHNGQNVDGVQTGTSGQHDLKEKRSSAKKKCHRQKDREKPKAGKHKDLVSRRRTKSSKHTSKAKEKKHKKKDVERAFKNNSSKIISEDSDSEEGAEENCDVKEELEVMRVDSSDSLATGESEIFSDPESGELSDQASENEENEAEKNMELDGEPVLYACLAGHDFTEPEISASYPPCVRVIVQESGTLEVGTFFLVTCPGGTIGRDKDPRHAIQIQDINVSKIHAEIMYDYDNNCYTVEDMGSQNGTFINSLRISEPKERSAAVPVTHGDTLQVGSTTMLLHIHPGSDTCDSCEPGQVLAALRAKQTVSKEHVIVTNAEKKKHAREQLKHIKKKYGLANSAYVDDAGAIKNLNYADKADLRRRFVGSQHPSHKVRQEVPTSVHRPISSENKGHRMLSKMGWIEGSGLGKDNTGRAEPVAVELRANQTAGLGAASSVGVSLDNIVSADKTRRLLKTQARYQRLETSSPQQHTDVNDKNVTPITGNTNESGEAKSTNSNLSPSAKIQIRWVKGDTQSPQ
ncbi:angiogenic factor with G patch and FHA domains 1-like isoform X1 [Littorina saxatilis]|uniref:angiogenic factor with G patch and FHA domains 1-like isoform X1 n=1 Tax=Littorina saxatilis TaxID=31220 RepID=UPI0038B68905